MCKQFVCVLLHCGCWLAYVHLVLVLLPAACYTNSVPCSSRQTMKRDPSQTAESKIHIVPITASSQRANSRVSIGFEEDTVNAHSRRLPGGRAVIIFHPHTAWSLLTKANDIITFKCRHQASDPSYSGVLIIFVCHDFGGFLYCQHLYVHRMFTAWTRDLRKLKSISESKLGSMAASHQSPDPISTWLLRSWLLVLQASCTPDSSLSLLVQRSMMMGICIEKGNPGLNISITMMVIPVNVQSE